MKIPLFRLFQLFSVDYSLRRRRCGPEDEAHTFYSVPPINRTYLSRETVSQTKV